MLRWILRLFEKHGRHFLTVTFFAGFIVDFIFLPSISNPIYPYIGIVYGALVGLGFILREAQLHLLGVGRGSRKLIAIVTIGTSFALGSLLSYVFIYYIRSGDLITSWPLYLLLLASIFVNEFSFKAHTKILINVWLFFVSIIFYIIFNTPLYYKEVSDAVFVRSIILGFLICYLYSGLFTLVLYNKKLGFKIYGLAAATPLLIATLYFSNTLPAVPLTLREEGIYSSVKRNGEGGYDFEPVKNTPQTFFGLGTKQQVFPRSGQSLYFYGAVVAPAKVGSSISHTWEKYNALTKKWEQKEQVSFPIIGGRKEGYRGYSVLSNVENGRWRVLVKVGGKRVVGQREFLVVVQ
jgi:Protein of unknown function (DUF2914)